VIPPRSKPGDDPDAVIAAVERFYAIGVQPDWWKLPPMPDPVAWRRLGDIVRANDPHCRGIIILGQEVSDDEIRRAFDAAAKEPAVRGFAIGRTIFWPAAEAWFAGSMDDAAAQDKVARAYAHVVELWNTRTAA
jgi:5-dehydro-2-deoxygluconokinase